MDWGICDFKKSLRRRRRPLQALNSPRGADNPSRELPEAPLFQVRYILRQTSRNYLAENVRALQSYFPPDIDARQSPCAVRDNILKESGWLHPRVGLSKINSPRVLPDIPRYFQSSLNSRSVTDIFITLRKDFYTLGIGLFHFHPSLRTCPT